MYGLKNYNFHHFANPFSSFLFLFPFVKLDILNKCTNFVINRARNRLKVMKIKSITDVSN